jgi:hypothetical protein
MKKFAAATLLSAVVLGGSLVSVAPAAAITPADVVPTATTTVTADCHGGQTANVFTNYVLFVDDTFTLALTNCNSHYAKPSTWDYGNVYTKVNSGIGGTGVRNPNTYALGNDQQCIQQNATLPGSWTGIPYAFSGITATMTGSIVAGQDPPYIYLYDNDQGGCTSGFYWHSKQLVYSLYPVTPTVTAAFATGSVATSVATDLTVTLTNTQRYRTGVRDSFTSLGFDIGLPTGASLDVAGAGGTCGGTVSQTTVSSVNTFRFTGGALDNATDSCTVVVPVSFPTAGTVTLNAASLKASSSNKLQLINDLSANVMVNSGQTISPDSQAPTLTVGQAMTPTTAYTPAGFTGTVTYSISPNLPAGLEFDTATGVVSGTPTTAQASANYTVTASDGSSTATATISIGISSASPVLSPNTQTVEANVGVALSTSAIEVATMPCVADMTISPDLPDGLSFDSSTGVISGTPTAVSASTSYVISYDCGGGNPYTATVTLSVGSGGPDIGDLVNTGLALLGPAGVIGILLALGAPFFFVSERFRQVRTAGAVVLHRSAHLTVTSPARFFDRLRRKK